MTDGLRKNITRIKSALDWLVDKTITILMVLIVLVVFLQVFSRYVLNSPFTWTEELARYICIWIVFLAAVIVFRENKHMSVDFVVNLLPGKIGKWVSIGTQLLIMAFLIVILRVSPGIVLLTMRQASPTMSIPMGFVYLSFPVSMMLMLTEYIFKVVLFLIDANKGVLEE